MFDNRAEDDLDEEFQIDKVQAHTDGKLERSSPVAQQAQVITKRIDVPANPFHSGLQRQDITPQMLFASRRSHAASMSAHTSCG